MKQFILRLYWISTQFGFDPLKFYKSLIGLKKYFLDYIKFSSQNDINLTFKPCLNDWYAEAGSTINEYFLQDLIVAQWVYASNPIKHVDIGSRIDGFVAHVASYREIEIFDVRPINTSIPNVNFRQLDLMENNFSTLQYGKCDSLSCLHTIEHFGLGRYGDPIQQNGYVTGLKNMASLLSKGGFFYFSTPIGKERVEFNANRVFNPIKIYDLIIEIGFVLKKFLIIQDGNIVKEIKINVDEIKSLSNSNYNLGIFLFQKI